MSLAQYINAVEAIETCEPRGRVTGLVGLVLRAFVPGARAGELCLVRSDDADLPAEVVGFDRGEALLLPLGANAGVALGAEVRRTHAPLRLPTGEALLGRVLGGLGQPIDELGPVGSEWRYVDARPPAPLQRARVARQLTTGVRAVDALLSVGEGQRVGLFAAAGVGKSTLLGMLARNCATDVIVVGLIGERGREVRDFVERDLGAEGLRKSVVFAATSDEPALVRVKAAHAATSAAEYFRDRGQRVLLLIDSITRFARALREVGLAVGEPPARAGFPPSTFAELPRLLERAGNAARGSITAFYTVLVEGDDLTEPVADEARSILDGHIVLSRALAESGHFPAIDVLRSVSRVMDEVAAPEHIAAARAVREALAIYEEKRDLIAVGAYRHGSDARVDAALEKTSSINAFLRQDAGECAPFGDTLARLKSVVFR